MYRARQEVVSLTEVIRWCSVCSAVPGRRYCACGCVWGGGAEKPFPPLEGAGALNLPWWDWRWRYGYRTWARWAGSCSCLGRSMLWSLLYRVKRALTTVCSVARKGLPSTPTSAVGFRAAGHQIPAAGRATLFSSPRDVGLFGWMIPLALPISALAVGAVTRGYAAIGRSQFCREWGVLLASHFPFIGR